MSLGETLSPPSLSVSEKLLSVKPLEAGSGEVAGTARIEKLTQYELGLRYDASSPAWCEQRDAHREVIRDPEASSVDKMVAAGTLAAYFHDTDPLVYAVAASRLREVQSDPSSRDTTPGLIESGAWLQLMIGTQYMNIYSPDIVQHAIEVNLVCGMDSRPSHLFGFIKSIYLELELHRQRIRLSDANLRVRRRMLAAIDDTGGQLLDELVDVFAKLRERSEEWQGETQGDREMLEYDREKLYSLLEYERRQRFGVWNLGHTDQPELEFDADRETLDPVAAS